MFISCFIVKINVKVMFCYVSPCVILHGLLWVLFQILVYFTFLSLPNKISPHSILTCLHYDIPLIQDLVMPGPYTSKFSIFPLSRFTYLNVFNQEKRSHKAPHQLEKLTQGFPCSFSKRWLWQHLNNHKYLQVYWQQRRNKI